MRRVRVCDISEIWRLVKIEKWCLRSLYIGSWNEWGLSCLTASGENPSVGSALHRWMYETTHRLEHLIALCETRSASGKFEVCEISPPTRVNWRIVWSYVVEVKTLFFPFLREGKIKVLRGYYRDKGLSWYTGPLALFGDVDTSNEKQMIGKAPEWRIK